MTTAAHPYPPTDSERPGGPVGAGGPEGPTELRESRPPTLLVMPDGDTRVDLTRRLLGRAPADRLARAALRAGFAEVLFAPGTRAPVAGTRELATGEPVGGPALVIFESAYVHPELLRLMVEHPLEPDERFTIYDGVGRPTGLFTGELPTVPAAMPISEELDWPEELGPESVGRLVYGEDRRRVELLVLRGERVFEATPTGERSLWRQHVTIPAIRVLANSGRPVPQLEVLALVLAVGSGGLALVTFAGTWVSLVFACLSLLAGVQISRVLHAVRTLRSGVRGAAASRPAPSHALVPDSVVRPFGHAALTAALTYALVAETGRSSVAGLVLLAIGAAAVLFSLGQARSLLRHRVSVPLELPSSAALAGRLGVRYPERYKVPIVLEPAAFVLALTGGPALPWGVLVAAGLARLWRWFAGPPSPSRVPQAPATKR